MPDLNSLIHAVEVLVFLFALLMLSRKIALGDRPISNSVGPSRLALRHYNVLPMLFLAVVVAMLLVGDEFSLFAEIMLLSVTLSMMMIGVTEHEDDKPLAVLSVATGFAAMTGLALSAYELYLTGCLL